MTKFVTAERTASTPHLARRSVLTFLGLATVSGCLAIMYFSMRVVMEVGGFCASGQTAFVIAHPCPSGVPGLMVGSIFIGLAGLGVYAVSAFSINLTLLAWPALFLSLGWNFLEYGVNPPGGGTSGGWLVCGVIFVLMGGLPLIFGIMAVAKGRETRVPKLDQDRLRERFRLSGHAPPPGDSTTDANNETYTHNLRRYAIALQLLAIVVGIFTGIQIYESVTGATVSFGFR